MYNEKNFSGDVMGKMKTPAVFYLLLTLCACLSLTKLWLKPLLLSNTTPHPPTIRAAKTIALGDDAWCYRLLAYPLQHAGDHFGTFMPLKLYDYKKLHTWFTLLDKLDATSHYVPAIAADYYSQSPNIEDVRYVVDYLSTHKTTNPGHWWWMSKAVYLATYRLHDSSLALTLAYKLAAINDKTMPLWAKQLPAFIHVLRGENNQAAHVMHALLQQKNTASQSERLWMQHWLHHLGYVMPSAP